MSRIESFRPSWLELEARIVTRMDGSPRGIGRVFNCLCACKRQPWGHDGPPSAHERTTAMECPSTNHIGRSVSARNCKRSSSDQSFLVRAPDSFSA